MKVARSSQGMVVAAHPLAAEAGREILAEGGNAVEAAVAVSLALGVVEPFASGLGGGGFMIVSPSGSIGKTEVLDGRGKVSSLMTEEHVYPRKVMLPWTPKIGPCSVAVPGLGRLLDAALRKWSRRMSLQKLCRRAIALASDGFEVGEVYAYCSSLFESTVRSSPECAKIYYNGGMRFKPGERLVQKDLARTLRLLAERGFDSCYTGEIGLALMRAVNQTGPVWGRDDLARYEVKVRAPLWADVAGHRIATTPPPSRGGAGIIQTLLSWDPDPVGLAVLLRSVFRRLDPVVGDPDLAAIDLSKLVEGPKGPPAGGGTSHFVVVDSEGTVVSMSQTIGHFFGSGVVAQGYGVLLNDDLSDMERFPGHPNSISANKRSVANMAPTIVFRNGKPRLALGTPGSVRIFPAMAQVIGNVVHGGMDLERAVAAGRVHWEEGRYFFEGDIPEEDRARAKRTLDEPVSERRRQDLFFGGVHAVEVLEDGTIVGVADPRREGVALPL
jgi:gamma-glutamyltranspeptidase/glutathione hydrolase